MVTIITIMSNSANLLRLMAWLSPVFPTGSFAYSSGLETAVQTGLVTNQGDLTEWLRGSLQFGAMKNDAIFLAQAWHDWDNPNVISELTDLNLAMAGSAERYLETTAQADAFTQAVRNWPETKDLLIPQPCSLPVAIGIAAAASSLDVTPTLGAYLQNFITNQVQAAIRLSVIGQIAAAEILSQMETIIVTTTTYAETSELDNLGSATVMAEIAAMQHEDLRGRMFRS